MISETNPYVGPRPIQQGEPLHGRTAEVSELYHLLQARRIVVLHSPSGAGKSSLVQAGLIPRLREGKFDVWKPIRVNLDPAGLEGVPPGTNRYLLSAMVSLEEELPAEKRRSPAALAKLDLLAYLESRPRRKGREGQPVVLLFDQFEEVLTVAPRAVDDKRAFFDAVGAALDTQRYWALFIIREDYLAAFAPYRDRIPTQMSNTFRLDLLGLEGAREAAEQPALAAGRTFPGVDRLVRDLSTVQVQQADGTFVAEQGLYVEPVHLQVVCRRLWDALPKDKESIDDHDIEAYASVSTALAGYYAQAVEKIARGDAAVERAVREWVGQKLVVGGIRSQVRQEAGRSAGLDNALVDALLASYLVRAEPRAGSMWYELGHDRLVEPVLEDNEAWEEKHLHPMQVQAKLWDSARRQEALLLSAEAVPEASAWAAKNAALVTDCERDFLALSEKRRAAERAARRRLQVLLGAAVVVAVVVAALGVLASVQRAHAVVAQHEATRSMQMASARELLARGQAAPAALVLAAVDEPEKARGFAQLAVDILSHGIPRTTIQHRDLVLAAAWSPDGRRVATASWDLTVRISNADATGEPVILRGHRDKIVEIRWSPDGKRVLTASEDHTARIWNADGTGRPVVLEGPTDPLYSAAWSPDGRRVAVASWDSTARVWNADGTGTPLVLRHGDKVDSVEWSPDGERIVTTSIDKKVRVWNADGSGVPIILEGHTEAIWYAAFSPDGKRIVSACQDHTARIWNADGSGEPIVLRGHNKGLRDADWSPDGKRIVTSSVDGTARVWSADGKGAPVVLSGHTEGIKSSAWSADGRRIVTASADTTARVWSADGTGSPLVLRGHTEAVWLAAWSPDDRRIVTASLDDTARLWDVDGRSYPKVFRGHEDSVTAAAWSPDGNRIATSSFDMTVRISSADGSGDPLVLRGHADGIRFVAWSPDGKRILTASEDRTARIWNADGSGAPVVLRGHDGVVAGVAWSPDGTRVATASWDKTARVWNADGTGDPIVLRGHELGVESVAWSPDGRRIATASYDKTARVWNADGSGAPVALAGHEETVRDAEWSPDGERIVTASEDRTVRVWNADGTGAPLVLRGHESYVAHAAFSPDGKRIVSASADQTARVWSADGSGDPLVLRGHDGQVRTAAWSPDGERILTGSYDKTARIWLVAVPALQRALRDATTDCLTPEDRQAYLEESDADAVRGYEACERAHGRTPFLVKRDYEAHEAIDTILRTTTTQPVTPVEGGPIAGDADALSACPARCAPQKWNGAWRTTAEGKAAACDCTKPQLVSSPTAGSEQAWDVEAGLIWDNADANAKCPGVCRPPSKWNGAWAHTISLKMSVCNCSKPSAQAAAHATPVIAAPVGPVLEPAGNKTKCVHRRYPDDRNGNLLHLWDCVDGVFANQRWVLTAGGLIVNHDEPGMCVHLTDAGWRDGNPLQLFSCSEGPPEGKTWVYDPATKEIHPQAKPTTCVMRTNPNWDNGNRLLLRDCKLGVADDKTWLFVGAPGKP